jgi:hypothetical protein
MGAHVIENGVSEIFAGHGLSLSPEAPLRNGKAEIPLAAWGNDALVFTM